MVVMDENYNQIADELERREVMNGGAVLSNVEYARLLAIYLYQNDLITAKFLWKRIPLASKSAFPELEAVWKVGRAMNRKNYQEVYTALKHSWSPEIVSLMKMVEGQFRASTINLIAKSYSSLDLSRLSKYLGCDDNEVRTLAEQNGWRIDGSLVYPVPPSEEMPDNRSEHNTFEKLTDCITFLEV